MSKAEGKAAIVTTPNIPPPPRPLGRCPHCGAEAILLFEDGSGRCPACGQPIRGRGHLQESGVAAAGLSQDAASTGPRSGDEFRRSKLLVGAIAAFGGIVLILAVPIGAVLSASFTRIAVETRFAALFSTYLAIGFCLLGLTLLLIGFYSVFLGYRHAVGEIPLGTSLLIVGIIGLIASVFMVSMLGSMVSVVGGVGGGLLIAAGVMDSRLG